MSRRARQDGRGIDLSDILYAEDVATIVVFSCLSQIALALRLWRHFLVEAGLVINWQKTKVMLIWATQRARKEWRHLPATRVPAYEEIGALDTVSDHYVAIQQGSQPAGASSSPQTTHTAGRTRTRDARRLRPNVDTTPFPLPPSPVISVDVVKELNILAPFSVSMEGRLLR